MVGAFQLAQRLLDSLLQVLPVGDGTDDLVPDLRLHQVHPERGIHAFFHLPFLVVGRPIAPENSPSLAVFPPTRGHGAAAMATGDVTPQPDLEFALRSLLP